MRLFLNVSIFAQDAAGKAFPGEEFLPLCYSLFSDESSTTLGGFKFHPIVLYLTLPLQKMRKADNALVIAYLPVVGAAETGITNPERYSSKMQDHLRELNFLIYPADGDLTGLY